MSVVTAVSRHAARRSAIRSFGPTSATASTSCVRDGFDRFALAAAEVELLDALGVLLPAVPAHERVVEVLALRAHAADVEREIRLQRVAQRLHVVADEDVDGRRDLEAGRRRRKRVAKRSGSTKIGSQPSAISDARATFFGPIAAR